jgi:outer membrane protein TolC
LHPVASPTLKHRRALDAKQSNVIGIDRSAAGKNMKLNKICLLCFILILLFFGCASKKSQSIENKPARLMIPADDANFKSHLKDASNPDLLKKPLALTDAVKIAITNNPDSAMAAARIRQAEAMIGMSKSSFWPRVGFYTEYLQGDAPSAYLFKTIDQRKFQATDLNNPGWFENFETGLTAKLNLYNSGKDVLKKKMAETDLSVRSFNRQGIENAIIASVINAFYSCLVSREYIKIAQESVTTVKEQLRIMQVRYKAGGALKSDVLSLEVRLAQVREDVVKSKNSLAIALAALANVMGISPDTEIELVRAQVQSIPIPEEYKTGVVYALKNRPELKKVREQIKQSKLAIDLSKSEYLPRIDALGNYYHDDPSMNYEKDRENWTVAVLLSWDLFTGLSTGASRKKAAAQLDEMLAADRKTILAIKLDVKTAYLRIAEAKARLEVAEASVTQAEESLTLVKKQYEGGSAEITRYLEAELARNHSRINATSAFYDREKARADAARSLGLLRKTF